MSLLIGADPEIWIKNLDTNKIISADGLFPGTKDVPHRVTHGAIQVDGMAAEFNIDPASTAAVFIRNTLSVMRDLRNVIQKLNPDLRFDFVFSPTVKFGEKYIQAQPEHAKMLGCTPDYNAYENGAPNPTPDAEMPFRTASGHIHLGWGEDLPVDDKEHLEACCMISKQLDVYVGAHSSFVEGITGRQRRDLYGKAGAFRPKSYGVEYRTMSNTWLRTVESMDWVYRQSASAFRDLVNGYRSYEDRDLREPINSGDKRRLRHYDELHWVMHGREKVSVENLDALVEKWNRILGENEAPQQLNVAIELR